MSAAQAKAASTTGTKHTGQGIFRGFTFRETGGSTAVVQVYDNTAASGTLLLSLALNAGQSAWDFQANTYFGTGVHVVVTGTVEGSVLI